ncbi:hypothetical protein ES703_38585 [subsurface metagenome]
MSKVSRRPGREEIKRKRKEVKQAQKLLRALQKAEGRSPVPKATRPNRTSPYETVEEEKEARTEAVVEQARIIRAKLPILLKELSKIPDPRNPQMIVHKLTCLLIYGILSFVLQMGSRRQANEELTAPGIKQELQQLFPDLETIPHHDTLNRLLSRIDVGRIEAAQIELIRSLIRDKKFQHYLIEGCYPIAVDGTQKLVSKMLWSEEWLEREVGSGEQKKKQYYVYVLEASLVFANGMRIPLMSEFMDYYKGDTDREKQDCEQRGIKRLAERLKKAFPHLSIMLLLDGMFASGPAMELCRRNNWEFMIVLQDGSLPQIWQEYEGLKKLLEEEDRFAQNWADRRQKFHWVNDIEYTYGPNGRNRQIVHLVICEESWEEVDTETGDTITNHSRHAWLSSKPLSSGNVHCRCNLGARHRWGIEEGILVEKRRGYQYEHFFSFNWNAMRGYHYLMRIGDLLNVLAAFSSKLIKIFKEKGLQGFIRFVRQTLSGRWLEGPEVQRRLRLPFQLRFV